MSKICVGGSAVKRDDIEKYCRYCELTTSEDVMLCERVGVVDSSHKCRRFRYDPLKRKPKRIEKDPELEYVEV